MVSDIKFEKIRCNLCGADDFKIVYKAKYDLDNPDQEYEDLLKKFKSSGDEKLVDQVVKCKNCGLVYINPRPKSDIIIEGYSEGTDENFVKQAKGRELTFKKSMKLIERFAPNKGRIYDVGTAGGSFLHVAKQRGWEVYGVEPNKWMCDWCKRNYGIEIKPGTIFDHRFPDNHFDVVTLWDVLEHVPDPTKVLEECSRILKEGGLLVVNYPDIGSWISRLMGSKWVFLISVHLYYFTPKTIRKMLKKTDFDTVKIKPHFQKLALGYLAYRMRTYSRFLSRIGCGLVNLLGMRNLQFPYWLGQTLIIAKKQSKQKRDNKQTKQNIDRHAETENGQGK